MRHFASRLGILLILAAGTSAFSTEYYVSTSTGSDSATCGTMASPCKTVNFTFTRLSPAPTQSNPATIHIAPGVYNENGGPSSPVTGFSVPNHTRLVSDEGADQTTLSLDTSYFAMYPNAVFNVVRGQQFGMGDNADDIIIDGFTITITGGVLNGEPLGLTGINFGAGFSTTIAPKNNIIRNNIISFSVRRGRTGFRGEGRGVEVGGGAKIDCNVFRNIDSIGVVMTSVDSSGGMNATLPGEVTRNWFHNFTNTPLLADGGAVAGNDEYVAVGVRVPLLVRGNLFDFTRDYPSEGFIDRRFSMVCFDCTGLVVQNNVFTGVNEDNGSSLALITQTPLDAGVARYAPVFDRNTIANSAVGLQAFDVPTNGRGGNNFAPTITNNILWTDVPARDFSNGSFTYNNALGSTTLSGTSNISSDPRFVNAASGDFRLQSGSPSLTAGQGNGQQGAYGGTTPFGAGASAPNLPCALRASPCVGLPNNTTCVSGPVVCANATTLSAPSCQQERCDSATRVQVSCDDGNPCTTDTCSAGVGCVHSPTSTCADGGTGGGSGGGAGGSGGGAGGSGGGAGGSGGGAGGSSGGAGGSSGGGVGTGGNMAGTGGSGGSVGGGSNVFPDGGRIENGDPNEVVIGSCGCASADGTSLWLLLALGMLPRTRKARRHVLLTR